MLVPILRAAHCRSTHHFFAVDALERVGTERGKRLAELLLKHYSRYLKGAKDPDDSFKDFQNHVIHVSQNNWGGAPRLCQQWFDKCLQLLNAGQWSDAAYACGVLSHYFTDPIMPLHTGQTERESVVHRPMEWSVCKAYEEILSLCQFSKAPRQIKLSNDSDWLTRAVLDGAAMAHEHYTRLIEIYNLPRGTVDPPRGLTKEARQILAELFDLAMGGWASILMRLAAQMNSVPPDCSLTLATIIAGVDMPRAALLRKFTNAAQQAEVKRIFDEYTETGKVVDNLPAEIKVVRQEFVKDQKAQQTHQREPMQPVTAAHQQPLAEQEEHEPEDSVAEDDDRLYQDEEDNEQANEIQRHLIAADEDAHDEQSHQEDEESESDEEIGDAVADADEEPEETEREHSAERRSRAEPLESRPLEAGHETRPNRSGSAKTLSIDSPLVDAPSIGPKTARRFAEIGIHTIEDFLSADATEMAELLETDWIKPELIEDWQDQAQLVCDVPALCGYKAQLLVAVHCRTADDLAMASVEELHHAIRQFGQTKEAERILRSTPIPSSSEVSRWIQSAQTTQSQ